MSSDIRYMEAVGYVYGTKWAANIIAALDGERTGVEETEKRYSQLKDELGISSSSTLTERRDKLVDYGLVEKKSEAGPPPEAWHSLTEKGEFHARMVRELEELEELGYTDEGEPVELEGRENSTDPTNSEYLARSRQIFGGKYLPAILRHIDEEGLPRYTELEEAAGIKSSSTLTDNLERLRVETEEGLGLVERIWYDEMPPRTEYSLTELGERYVDFMEELEEEDLRMRNTLRKR